MKCERCQARTSDYDLFDYCARCSRNLCSTCTGKGCCGVVPAASGHLRDDAAKCSTCGSSMIVFRGETLCPTCTADASKLAADDKCNVCDGRGIHVCLATCKPDCFRAICEECAGYGIRSGRIR